VLEADSRFCDRCGADLTPSGLIDPDSPASVNTRSPGSYTPSHLAEKILTSRSALEGERKQVTVLFVDVSGFTSLSERLDPEDVHGFMTRAFELMLAEVHRYEGTVNQFLGDGIMALFGAPIAHEDHAQRGVRAALGIRTALERYRDELRGARDIGFQVRQGLNTGLVVVGSIGTDLRMDYTAVGDTTNVAARLQQTADPGRIVISEPVHRLVAGYFHTRPLGTLAVKGKAEPLNAWEVVSARITRSRLDVEAERGLTPFVGRDGEFRLLNECFDRVKDGHGQVVLLVGEPGIGKSRLLLEFHRSLADDATWVEGRSMSFGQSIALHPVIDLLKRTFRIEEADAEAAVVEKVERAVLRLGEDLRPTLPYLRYLLSVDPGVAGVQAMDPQLRRAEINEAIRRLLLRAAEVRPQVVVYEDVHWMDRATEEQLALLAESVATARVLMILSYRPGYTHSLGERSYHTRIALTTLSGRDSARMAEAMLATKGLAGDLVALIMRKAEGNPFFVEEVVKSLQEVGAIRQVDGGYILARRLDEIVVPDTIQDVIMARIDRLEDASKKTLQLAAVIGREFTRRLLDRIADIRGQTEGLLRELKSLELVYEKSLFPELAYMFKHALTHDVAYHSLLVQRRKELHHVIGLAIEELYADRLTEHYEVLAYHFGKAEAWAQAFAYLVRAAEKATNTGATREALALYDQALEAANHLGDAVDVTQRMRILQGRADLYHLRSDFHNAQAEASRWLALARDAGNPGAESLALASRGLAAFWAHDFATAQRDARAALSVGAGAAPSALARAHLTLAWTHKVHGRLSEGGADTGRSIQISRAAGDVFHQSLATTLAGERRNWEGDLSEASRMQSEGLQLAREHNLALPLIFGLFTQGITLTGLGNYDGALELFNEGVGLTEKVGDEIFFHRLLNCLGWLHFEVGDLERAANFNLRGSEGARKRGDPETFANAELNLADIWLVQGDLGQAQELLEGIERVVVDPGTSDWQKWRYSMHLFTSFGELFLARGDFARTRAYLDRALEIAARTTSRKYLVKVWRLRGELALARRQWDDADGALREALALAHAVGNPTQLWKTHLAQGRLATAQGNRDLARQGYESARSVIERVDMGLRSDVLRGHLKRSPLIRDISELSGPR
jgi:class 3 adenylate cyclase/tetratricopeptide (TPR) repeat protein